MFSTNLTLINGRVGGKGDDLQLLLVRKPWGELTIKGNKGGCDPTPSKCFNKFTHHILCIYFFPSGHGNES